MNPAKEQADKKAREIVRDLIDKSETGEVGSVISTHLEPLYLAIEALEEIACFGNGDKWGNSDGNMIAQRAILKLRKSLAAIQPKEVEG